LRASLCPVVALLLLRTFGGLSVEADPVDGPVPSIGPRRLALLALVAAAGTRGVTREKILGILWAETEEEQARHTLSQTLYLLRRETGHDWISGTAQLRLDPSARSDVGEFQDALTAEDFTRASACYTGPFLEGFYLAGAPEFEQWVEETRARFQFAALKALEAVAKRASDAGAFAEALTYWRRLGEIDPFSATYAAGHIRTLIAQGDQVGALRFAREYEARVQRELDASPDPVIIDLIEALRTPRKLRIQPTPPVAPADPQFAPEPPATVSPRARARVSHWKAVVAAVVVAAGIVTAVAWNMLSSRAGGSRPFLAIGFISSRDTSASGPVLRDMLATNLGRMNGVQVVANSRLLELLPGQANAPTAIADAARRAGASELVEGEVGRSGNKLVLTLRRVALEGGLVRKGYSVRATDAYALIDSATAALAHDLGVDPPATAVATVRTKSAVAYAMYEEGLRGFYAGNPVGALRLMEAALERDSSFAMAAYFGWFLAHIMDRYADRDRLLPIAKRLATRAVERERLIIEANIARMDAPATEYLAIARRLAERYPSDPDGQIALANALGFVGDYPGALAAHNRAIALDSAAGAATGSAYCRVCEAINGIANLYVWWDSAAAAERTAQRLIRFRPHRGWGYGAGIEALLRQGKRAEAEAAITKANQLDGPNEFWSMLDRDLIRSGRLDELEAKFRSLLNSARPAARSEIAWLYTILMRNQGRLREAQLLASRGRVAGISHRAREDRDRVSLAIIALEAGKPRESAQLFFEAVPHIRNYKTGEGWLSRDLAWTLTLGTTALAAAGDTTQVRTLADSVEQIGARSSFGRDFKLHFFLRGLLLQRENRHAEAVEAFRRSLFSTTDGYTRINLEMARSLMALGRYQEAVAILQPAMRGGVDGSNTYVTHTELHYTLAHAWEGAQQQDSARAHYAAVERAWRRADPEFAQRYREAKAKATGS